MSIPFAQINRKIRFKLLSKEEKVRVAGSLFSQVEEGDVVEHFFKSAIWEKIICPWLESEEETADRRLRDCVHEIPQDEVGFWERGKVRLIEDFRSMLEEKLKDKKKAQQKLLELQLVGEKDDGKDNR